MPNQENTEHKVAKYRLLFDSARAAFDEEKSRAARLDEKATRLFGLITFLIGLIGYVSESVVSSRFPPNSILDWLLIILLFACLASLAGAWWSIFGVLRLGTFPVPAVRPEFFDKNTYLTVLRQTAVRYEQRKKDVRALADDKAKRTARGYSFIYAAAVVLLLVFLTLALAYVCGGSSRPIEPNGGCVMSDDQDSNQSNDNQTTQAPPEPDMSVEAPDFEWVTESYNRKPPKEIRPGDLVTPPPAASENDD